MALQTDFYLSQLNIEVNAIQATLHGGENTDELTGHDATARLNIPVSYARHLFQYQADALDVNDLNSQDIKFRMFHRVENSGAINGNTLKMFNTKNILPAEASVIANPIHFYGNASQAENEKKVNADFVRYVAEQVFGVSVTDLFNNERPVRVDLNRKAAFKFNETIDSLVGFKVNYGTTEDPDYDYVRIVTNSTTAPDETADNRTKATEFPSRLIFSQLMNHPDGRSRFANLNSYDGMNMRHLYTDDAEPVGETEENLGSNLWRYMPLAVDDKLYFNLTVNPHGDQETVTGGELNLEPYVYRIQLYIVADNDAHIVGKDVAGDYVRGWDNNGWDSGSAIDNANTSSPLSYLVAGTETGADIVNPEPEPEP